MLDDKLMTRGEVAEALRTTVGGLSKMYSRGSFPKPLKRGRRALWPESQIRAYIDRQWKAANPGTQENLSTCAHSEPSSRKLATPQPLRRTARGTELHQHESGPSVAWKPKS